MSQLFFPATPSLSWSVHRKPTFSTRVSKHVSGRTVRLPLMATPLYGFELTYEVLRADTAHGELQMLEGFFLARQGQFDSFLFAQALATGDPADSWVGGQLLGTADGTSTTFVFTRSVGAYVEPVGQVEPSGLKVCLGGVVQDPSSYTVSWPNVLTFAATPAAGQRITADYRYYYVCCFDDDVHDYENFMHQLWTLQSCKFTTVKP